MTGLQIRPRGFAPRVFALVFVVACMVVGWAGSAAAEVQGPRQQAQQLITELETKTDQRALVDSSLTRARLALNRATQARRAQQLEQAAVLERVALGWAQLGQLLLKTVALEAEATKLETTQNDLDTRIKRARALLEETLARRARAQETLKKLEQPAPASPSAASSSAAPAAAAAPAAPTAPAAAPAPAQTQKKATP